MPSLTKTELNVSIPTINSVMPFINHVIGAAIFDPNGLPKEYFTTSENTNMSWVQTIFQALGLRSLLMSSLQLEGFHHASIQADGYCAIVVKQKSYYTALLLKHQNEAVPDAMIEWAQTFEPSLLQEDPRFHIA